LRTNLSRALLGIEKVEKIRIGLGQRTKQRRVKYAKSKLFDANYNIELGTYYFKGLVDLTGTPEYALAAYNAGENAVIRAGNRIPAYPETVNYVPKVLGLYQKFQTSRL